MAKTININGVDFTSYFTTSGFVCAYTKIDGGNGGTMKNGDTIQDIVAVKARGQATCMPLTEEQQKSCYQQFIAVSLSCSSTLTRVLEQIGLLKHIWRQTRRFIVVLELPETHTGLVLLSPFLRCKDEQNHNFVR